MRRRWSDEGESERKGGGGGGVRRGEECERGEEDGGSEGGWREGEIGKMEGMRGRRGVG